MELFGAVGSDLHKKALNLADDIIFIAHKFKNTQLLRERNCYVSVCFAAYGRPSSLVIQFEGSPARGKIYVDILSSIIVGVVLNGKKLTPTKGAKTHNFVVDFLKDIGVSMEYSQEEHHKFKGTL